MIREVRDVKWVRVLAGRPGCIPQGRPQGAKAAGVRYENALAAHPGFAVAQHGVWFEFSDTNGHGFAQADFLFPGDIQSDILVVAEVKLTWKLAAYIQLRNLYLPLLRSVLPNAAGIVVCQNLTQETPRSDVVDNLAEALARARFDPTRIPTLHLPLGAQVTPRSPATKPKVPKWWGKGEAKPARGAPILGV